MSERLPSRCPSCGARGVYLVDEVWVDGYPMRFDYCGKCGRNYPHHLVAARLRREDPSEARQAEPEPEA
jgi:hypothetical protein